MNEFEIIEKYFAAGGPRRSDVVVGIGDDGAVLETPPGQQLVVTTDVLVSGVHFAADGDAEAIGYKSLAVNLSDLAAMGAEPAWATLGLTLPEVDQAWLDGFARGFLVLAARHGVQLVGGDTTRGPLTISVQLTGFVPKGAALLRSGARSGDDIYVTGEIGDAALTLAALQGRVVLAAAALKRARRRLDWPEPRVRQGVVLRGLASAAIDISDGLLADLEHLARSSRAGAVIESSMLPLSADLRAVLDSGYPLTEAISGGDDYELCFTAARARRREIEQAMNGTGARATRIGVMTARLGVTCLGPDGEPLPVRTPGYRHFQ